MHSMKRQCVLCLLMLFVSMWINAQNLSVKSFRLLETDLTANLEGTKEIDQNGEVAALIKVITTETGFLFDVGMMGIVRQVQKPGEIWLYVPHGVMRININHQRLGRLDEPYYFQIPIQAARTYELVLTAKRVKTIILDDDENDSADSTETNEKTDVTDTVVSTPISLQKEEKEKAVNFYGSADLQLGAPLAFGASLGGYWHGLNLEASVGIPFGEMQSSGEISWSLLGMDAGEDIYKSQRYKANLFLSGHIGYGFRVARWLRITPRVGFCWLNIVSQYSTLEQRTGILAVVPSLRTEFSLNPRIGLYATPQWNAVVKQGEIAEKIVAVSSSDTKLWNRGFHLNVGIYFNF